MNVAFTVFPEGEIRKSILSSVLDKCLYSLLKIMIITIHIIVSLFNISDLLSTVCTFYFLPLPAPPSLVSPVF